MLELNDPSGIHWKSSRRAVGLHECKDLRDYDPLDGSKNLWFPVSVITALTGR